MSVGLAARSAAKFNPAQFSLAAWFDAKAITGLADGAAVSSWADLSGHGRNAVQATPANQPIYKVAGVNGFPSVRFASASSQYLKSTFGATVAQPLTIFCVMGSASAAPAATEFIYAGIDGTNNCFVRITTSGFFQSACSTAMTTTVAPPQGTGIGDLLTFVANGASSSIRVNGQTCISGNGGAAGLAGVYLGTGAFVNSFFSGDICELIVVQGALGTDDLKHMERYLARKWGVIRNKALLDLGTPSPFAAWLPNEYNAAASLTIPTYDASNKLTHPDVLFFPNGWGADSNAKAWKYWMCMTPYPGGNANFENPSIVVSDDGQTWVVPPGLTNPIDPQPAGGFNSDGALVMDVAGTTMYCYFRERQSTPSESIIKYCTTTDGIHWAAETVAFFEANNVCLSPTILYFGGQFWMWTIDNLGGPLPENLYYRTASSLAGPWSAPTVCTITNTPPGRDLWHIDALLMADGTLTLALAVCDHNGSGANSKLHFARSRDGIAWSCSPLPVLDTGPPGQWDHLWIYRSSIRLDTTGQNFLVWYGAEGTDYFVGYTTIPITAINVPALP